MPYIRKESRKALDKYVNTIPSKTLNIGELNYVITKILLNHKPKNYQDYNQLIGVLECIKLEFYRRMVAPYEDLRKQEQGEIY